MAWNTSSYTFDLLYDFTTDAGAGAPNHFISSTKFDAMFDDIALGMEQSYKFGTAFRNKALNGDFQVWSNGTTFSSDGEETADRWYLTEGTGATVQIDRQTFAVGQTAVPDNPTYYLRWARSVVGSTVSGLYHQVPTVARFSGQTVTMTFWARASAGTPSLEITNVQHFGTGGSPSSDVTSDASQVTLDTTWTKYTIQMAIPSVSGKILGSNADDNTKFRLHVPVSEGAVTFELSHVQIEANTVASPFEVRDTDLENVLITGLTATSTFVALTDTPGTLNAHRLLKSNSAGNAVEEGPVTFPAADGSANQILRTDGAGALSFINPNYPPGFLSGLDVTVNSTDAEHDIDIAAGSCRNADDDGNLDIASALTKQLDASWASGTNAGGLSSTLTPANNTEYYVFAIEVSGAADVGFDTSATAANLVTDHSITNYREIGRFITDGSANISVVFDRNQVNAVAVTTQTTPSGGADGDVWYVYS